MSNRVFLLILNYLSGLTQIIDFVCLISELRPTLSLYFLVAAKRWGSCFFPPTIFLAGLVAPHFIPLSRAVNRVSNLQAFLKTCDQTILFPFCHVCIFPPVSNLGWPSNSGGSMASLHEPFLSELSDPEHHEQTRFSPDFWYKAMIKIPISMYIVHPLICDSIKEVHVCALHICTNLGLNANKCKFQLKGT